MTSLRQIESNRLNCLKSTGPRSEEGKQRSRVNAVRHGLTAETVISSLEDAADYEAFEQAVCAGYDPLTAVERELVLRLASVLWRLRRANLIETQLFRCSSSLEKRPTASSSEQQEKHLLADAFLALLGEPSKPIDRLARYETALWRQARQLLIQLRRSIGSSNRRTKMPF